MDASDLVTLAHGPLRLELAPAIGGAIAGFRRDGVAILREAPAQAVAEGLVRQMASYPLIPYSNRIAGGRFTFEGEAYRLAPNFGDHPHSVHGNAWQRRWSVAALEPARCRLVLDHRPVGGDAEGWPFAYRAEQAFVLDDDGLAITLTLTNEDGRPMPAGLGLHPFFPKRPGTSLRFQAEAVLRNGPDSLPASREPVPPEWDYGALRPLGEPGLDNCFAGFDGSAEIRYSNENIAVRIEADAVFGHLVVYVPSARDYFAVEPVSHMNDAIHHPEVPGNGLVVLNPGETLSGTIRFRIGTAL
ncbi:MAG: aldose 1-epimerase [Microvirga sp.]